jgi:hypothetical protein
MRFPRYSSETKAVAAGQTSAVVFPAEQLPKSRCVALSIQIAGAGNDLADIDRFVVKVDGDEQVSLTLTELRVMIQRLSRGNILVPTTATEITIPFYMPDAKGSVRDEQQLAPGNIELEIYPLATVAIGTFSVSYQVTDVDPRFYFRTKRTQLNVAATTDSAERVLNRPGKLRGFIINTTGLTELKLSSSGVQVVKSPGWGLIQANALENKDGTPTTDPLFHRFYGPIAGEDLVAELKTAATWGGVNNMFTSVGYTNA